MVQVLHVIEYTRNGVPGIFDKLWTRLLKLYDKKIGIKWDWQSLDSISIKSPLRGE